MEGLEKGILVSLRRHHLKKWLKKFQLHRGIE